MLWDFLHSLLAYFWSDVKEVLQFSALIIHLQGFESRFSAQICEIMICNFILIFPNIC